MYRTSAFSSPFCNLLFFFFFGRWTSSFHHQLFLFPQAFSEVFPHTFLLISLMVCALVCHHQPASFCVPQYLTFEFTKYTFVCVLQFVPSSPYHHILLLLLVVSFVLPHTHAHFYKAPDFVALHDLILTFETLISPKGLFLYLSSSF